MKRHLTQRRKRLKFVLGCLFWLMMFNNLNAQNITLTWDKESGCQVYKPREKEDFNEDIGSGNCVRVCEESEVTYTLNNSSSTWPTLWTVTGGTIIGPNNGTSCLVVWGSSGYGFVSATVQTPDGPSTKQMCLEVITGPKPSFTIVPGQKEFCLEETIYFTNTSSANGGSQIISYLWNFDDGNYSSEFEPNHAYTKPGPKTVTLTVTNECNCSRTYKYSIYIHETIAFPITCNSVVCENDSDDYSIPDEVAAKCNGQNNWKVEGGTITSPQPYGATITVKWDNVDSSGFGYVIYDGSACGLKCAQIAIKVPVVTSKTKIVGEDVTCAYTQYRYKLPQWPTTDFVWSIVSNGTGATIMNTDQRNEVIITTGMEGNIILRCTYQNSMLKCGGYTEYNIYVKAMGVISGPIEVCQNTTQSYSVNNGYTGTWTLKKPNNSTVNFTGNSFSYLFDVPGNYTLTVTGNDFCSPSAPFIIRVDAIPTAPNANDIVGPAKVCTASPVEYRLTNTVPGTVLVWEAINGTISGSNYGDSITVEFTPGFASYGVRVWRENTAEPHCISTKTTKVVTEHVVTLNITTAVNPVCASSVNGYSVAYSEGEVYEWSVSPAHAGSVASGNGTNSVDVLWNQLVVPNTFVVLRVRKCNVWHTTSIPVTVMLSPTVTIGNVPASVCPDDFVSPTLTATLPVVLTSGTITWNFGDGSPTVTLPVGQPLPPHQYGNVPLSTTYTITAIVENPNGCITPATAIKNVTVNPAPVALITPDTHRVFCNTVSPFVLTATMEIGQTVQWYNGTNPILGATSSTYNVTTFGDFRALVKNANGCGQYTNTVRVINNCGSTGCTILPMPTVSMDAFQGGCNMVSATSITTPPPVSHSWSAGPEATPISVTQNAASYSFKKAGNYTIIYNAVYMDINNQPCVISKIDSQIIPYIPRIKYSVSCSSSGMYTITLEDKSNYYPQTPLASKTFIVGNNQYPVPTNTSTYTVTVAPGIYNLGIQLGATGFLTCSDIVPVNLPAMPNSGITSPGTTCDGTGFQLSPSAGVVPGLYYNWNFGDGSTNLQPQPVKVYGSSGTKTVSLTVSNIYGCSSTSSVNVNVAPNQLNGNLTSTSPNCEGDPIIITYNSTGTAPTTYTWMKDQAVVGTTTIPTFQVNTSGSYWVTVGNALGCKRAISTTPAKFIMSPDPVITGPDGVCVYQSFKLSGYAGGGNLQYRWLLGGNQIAPWSSSAILNHTLTTAGAYTFKVEVRVPDGSGGYCVSSDTYAVTAYATPQAPQLTFDVVYCNPYTVKLSADAGTPGTYTWSNGGVGPDIEVNKGGPFMVTFTNLGGCTSTAQFDVPKDPEEYFWIFPKGCYEFCMDRKSGEGSFDILGPAPQAQFGKWIWLKDFSMDQGGVNSVPNYNINSSGTYQMGLLNGICYKETENMEVNVIDCKCNIKFGIKNIKADSKPFCHFLIDMHIDNPYGYPIEVNISAANSGMGIFMPSVVTVPPGGGVFNLNFIPTGFTGGNSMEIILTTTLEKGEKCRTKEKFVFPRCELKSQAMVNPNGDGDTNNPMARLNSLVVAPNPSTDLTGLTYAFANEKAMSRSIEIYSLMGVLLETHTPEAQEGKWTVNLGRYAAGQYIVVMREDGVSVAQKAIIKQ